MQSLMPAHPQTSLAARGSCQHPTDSGWAPLSSRWGSPLGEGHKGKRLEQEGRGTSELKPIEEFERSPTTPRGQSPGTRFPNQGCLSWLQQSRGSHTVPGGDGGQARGWPPLTPAHALSPQPTWTSRAARRSTTSNPRTTASWASRRATSSPSPTRSTRTGTRA